MVNGQCEGCKKSGNLIDGVYCKDCFNVLLAPYGAYIEVDNA